MWAYAIFVLLLIAVVWAFVDSGAQDISSGEMLKKVEIMKKRIELHKERNK